MVHWGNNVWMTFHLLSYSYDPKEKARYINFIKDTAYILPCQMCTDHFRMTLFRTNFDAICATRGNIIRWMNRIHNDVNGRLGKKKYSLKECKKIYYFGDKLNPGLENRIIGYINLVKDYISNGMDIIMKQRVINTVVNLCYIYPYVELRKELAEYAKKNKLELTNGKKWIKNVIRIIRNKRKQVDIKKLKDAKSVSIKV